MVVAATIDMATMIAIPMAAMVAMAMVVKTMALIAMAEDDAPIFKGFLIF